VASLGSYTRSAARATFSAYRSLPIRWRLAGGSAVLTCVILCGFAAIVGVLTTRQVRGQFNDEIRSAIEQLQQQFHPVENAGTLDCNTNIQLSDYASAEHAQIRVFNDTGLRLCSQTRLVDGRQVPVTDPAFTLPTHSPAEQFGYRIEFRFITWSGGEGYLFYARPLSDIDHTLAKVRVFLILGVFGGTILALLAGLALAQRAMRPVAELTDAAREIERTRDPSLRLPHPEADDEVAELARTLEGMLHALGAARSDTEAMLDRQREFVADASHELRTPLTSVLANLELLGEELEGEQAETAQAALRSTQRMRRLVGDLLLLARADAKRIQPHRPVDLADALLEAVAELEPVADDRHLSVSVEPAVVEGSKDELHRLVLNLLENAIRHTPLQTQIRATVSTADGEAVLVVEDDGPGIPPELERRVFERFVRGGRDGARGSGLGLAIVSAVVASHNGTITLEHPGAPAERRGTRFVIRIPLAAEASADDQAGPATGAGTSSSPAATGDSAPGSYTSTTTGNTIGRRRRRS
jgi:two-component system, OmpR family, sensor kinase